MKFLLLIQCFLGLIQFSKAQAQAISIYNREQVRGLPKGRFIVSDVRFQSALISQFNSDGVQKNISDNINRKITFSDITQDDKIRTQQLAGLFKANDLTLSESAGTVTGSIDSLVDGHVPVIGYALTDSLSMIFSIPIINFRIEANYQFIQSEATKKFLNKLQQEDQSSSAQDIKAAFNSSLESKLYRAGYVWRPSVDEQKVGDLQITFLKQLKSNDALFLNIVLPTAESASSNDLYQLKGGEKKWALGAKYSQQKKYDNGFILSSSFENTITLPSKQMRRLYLDVDQDLKEGLDENTSISSVYKMKYQFQSRYEFPSWLSMTLGFNWQYQTAEAYSGDRYDSKIYALSSSQSEQELTSVFAAIDLNSINSFLKNQFIIPLSVELGVSRPMSGRNALGESVYQFQGSLFF